MIAQLIQQGDEFIRTALLLQAAAHHADCFTDNAIEIDDFDVGGLERIAQGNRTRVPGVAGLINPTSTDVSMATLRLGIGVQRFAVGQGVAFIAGPGKI